MRWWCPGDRCANGSQRQSLIRKCASGDVRYILRRHFHARPSAPFINIKSSRRLSPVSGARLYLRRPVHEGRFARRSEVEQSLRTGRNGASPKPTDTASCAYVPRKHAPGGLGSPPGLTMEVCHRLAGRGAGEGEEIRRMRGLKFAHGLYPEARSQNLKPPGRSAGRRFRGLWFPAIRRSCCGTTIKVRLSALRRPSWSRGED